MSTVVLLAGSPSQPSKSTALLQRAAKLLRSQGVKVIQYGVHDFPAEDLINARWNSPAISEFRAVIADSDGLIISTPVYKAAYSGVIKAILDLLPERALEGKAALALATGGSPGHLLAVEYALQPVLSALKARHIVGGVYATDKDFTSQEPTGYQIAPEIDERLALAIGHFLAHLSNPGRVQLDPAQLAARIQQASISI
ncbi:NADPH-dependent FMN reductase [Chitinibacter tainanensis]|uniref:NADPH-dependent FMN reductase n=1 Tax=Chitinibacter tainanensis TaxID=230667 RepID=UPI0023576616|nr:NADPH-dependent FMN reductase [Chitinibacter tainanensis]